VQAGEEERGVILASEELERGRILERVDVVLAGEVDGVRAFQGILRIWSEGSMRMVGSKRG
jgi:hypothetical protein